MPRLLPQSLSSLPTKATEPVLIKQTPAKSCSSQASCLYIPTTNWQIPPRRLPPTSSTETLFGPLPSQLRPLRLHPLTRTTSSLNRVSVSETHLLSLLLPLFGTAWPLEAMFSTQTLLMLPKLRLGARHSLLLTRVGLALAPPPPPPSQRLRLRLSMTRTSRPPRTQVSAGFLYQQLALRRIALPLPLLPPRLLTGARI